MRNRPPLDPESELLPQSVVAPLLARASELDAARAALSEVSALRAAATEAGISEGAFDAALAEMRRDGGADLPRRRSRTWALVTMAAALIAAGTFGASRLVPGGPAEGIGPLLVEEALLLRCLSPAEAADLIRPFLRDGEGSVVISPERASRVITIRATPIQIEEVVALLRQYETSVSPVCAARGEV